MTGGLAALFSVFTERWHIGKWWLILGGAFLIVLGGLIFMLASSIQKKNNEFLNRDEPNEKR